MARNVSGGIGLIFATAVGSYLTYQSVKLFFDGLGEVGSTSQNSYSNQNKRIKRDSWTDEVLTEMENMDTASKVVLGGAGTFVFVLLTAGAAISAKNELSP